MKKILRNKMKILISGTWRKDVAKKYKRTAEELGKALAENEVEIISGGGLGISKRIVDSYRKNKGKKSTAYYPLRNSMKKVGEIPYLKHDKIIYTNLDYPKRNIKMVKDCDGLIVLTGGLGTLTEIIHAIKDYNKKVAVLNYDKIAKWCKSTFEIKKRVLLTKNINQAINYLKK